MTKTTHLFLTAVAFAFAAAVLLIPGTAAAFPADTNTPANSPGTVNWRFQVSGSYVAHGPVVGPDGGVVVASSSGNVYSLTSAGSLRWVVRAGADGLSVGADGTVYVGSMNTITAIAANGSIRWTFTEQSVGQGVIAGPTVGPDGNIYVISDYGGLGAFALSPGGQLLWSNSGSPTFAENAQSGVDIVFGSGRLYAAFDERAQGPSTMYGLSLGGIQNWATPIGGSDDAFMQQQRQPATGVDGSLYLTAMGGGNGWGLRRVDPTSGNVLWNYSPWPSNGMSPPSVGPDGSVYFSRSLSFLESVTPTGSHAGRSSTDLDRRSPCGEPGRHSRRRRRSSQLRLARLRPRVERLDRSPSPGRSTCPTRMAVSRLSRHNPSSPPTAGPRTSVRRFSPEARSTPISTRWTQALRRVRRARRRRDDTRHGASFRFVQPEQRLMTGSGSTRTGRVIAQSPAASCLARVSLPLGEPRHR